ncbi:MAG: TIGR00725 family protein [Aquificaceae bacterium]|nr:TIGR00725 family protein [Aquificaceae bacterium]MDW8236940.1 TIGR00725 family protein [Aquificaceae bacterium]
MPQISVIGSSNATPEELEFAFNLGIAIGKERYTLICGGRGGVMEAACKGCQSVGGISVGILPTYDGSDANNYLSVVIKTGIGWARNALVVASGDVIVAVGGSFGTLSEIAYAFILKKPIIGYKTHKVEGLLQANTISEIMSFIKSHLEKPSP